MPCKWASFPVMLGYQAIKHGAKSLVMLDAGRQECLYGLWWEKHRRISPLWFCFLNQVLVTPPPMVLQYLRFGCGTAFP